MHSHTPLYDQPSLDSIHFARALALFLFLSPLPLAPIYWLQKGSPLPSTPISLTTKHSKPFNSSLLLQPSLTFTHITIPSSYHKPNQIYHIHESLLQVDYSASTSDLLSHLIFLPFKYPHLFTRFLFFSHPFHKLDKLQKWNRTISSNVKLILNSITWPPRRFFQLAQATILRERQSAFV